MDILYKKYRDNKPPKPKGIDFTEDEIEKAIKQNKPLMLMIDFTNRCNLKCPYCFNNAGTKYDDELTTEEYFNILDQAKEMGVKTIFIPGSGEPLLQKDLRTVINHIYSLQIPNIILFTNGKLLNDDLLSFLDNRKVTLGIKWNSYDPEVQNLLVGEKKDSSFGYEHNKLIEKINLKYNFSKEIPTRVWLDNLISTLNYDHIIPMFMWARYNNWWPGINTLLHLGRGQSKLSIKLTPSIDKVKSIFFQLNLIDKIFFGFEWEPIPPYVAWYCDFYYYSIKIDCQGNVTKCIGLSHKIGNIRKQSLQSLWNNSFNQKFINIPKIYKNISYGCPCRRYLKFISKNDRDVEEEEVIFNKLIVPQNDPWKDNI